MVPTIWVEGGSDIAFYRAMSDGIPCRVEAFDGYENSRALVEALQEHDYPYVVVRDGDYRILKRQRAPHRWVLMLPRYSFENFLWDLESVNRVCCDWAQCGDERDLVSQDLSSTEKMVEERLLGAIIVDVAARRSNSRGALPDHVEQILERADDIAIAKERVTEMVAGARSELDDDQLATAERDVMNFVSARCVAHLLKGHLLFGLLRIVVLNACERERGKRRNISKELLRLLLVEAIGRHSRAADYRRVKKTLRSKVRVAGVALRSWGTTG